MVLPRNCVQSTGDGRFLPDDASASSDDSVKPPPRLDPSRIKPGPGALPAEAFDPLKHDEWEQFWHTVDQHFQPVNEGHIGTLRSISVNPYGGVWDHCLRVPPETAHHIQEAKLDIRREKRDAKRFLMPPAKPEEAKDTNPLRVKAENALVNLGMIPTSPCLGSQTMSPTQTDPSIVSASLNSFPLTHRLIAALLDECGTGTAPPAPVIARSNRLNNTGDECLWMGIGIESGIRAYQAALEDRVKLELSEAGLLDITHHEPLQTTLRNEQWKLRDIKTMNQIHKGALYNRIVSIELRQQAIEREIKRHCDQVEMDYLARMVRNMKKNKKSRSKFQKLLQRMFGHYKDRDRANDKTKKVFESKSNGRLLTTGEEKVRGGIKKRKKKDSKGPPNIIVANGTISRPGAL